MLKTTLFPNPNNGNFVLKANKTLEQQKAEICIYDITGKEILKEKISNRVEDTSLY